MKVLALTAPLPRNQVVRHLSCSSCPSLFILSHLAQRTGADEAVVRLFALFHDSRRENDGYDTGHGTRGSWYARELRGSAYELSDERFELLRHACEWHTVGRHHGDPTIATCWDADRLDLGRVGITPNPDCMSTEPGREIAAAGRPIEEFFRLSAGP